MSSQEPSKHNTMEREGTLNGQPKISEDTSKMRKGSLDEDAIETLGPIPIDEASPLIPLDGNRKDGRDNDSQPLNAWYDPQFEGLPWYKKPSIYWIIAPFLMIALAYGGIIVTKLILIEDLLCEKYFASKATADPKFSFMPVIIGKDNRQCEIPEVSSLTAEFMLLTSLLSGIPSAFVAPTLGAYSDRWGRTRVMAVASTGSLISEIITIVVASYPTTVSVYWILLGSVFEGLSGSFIVSMAVANAYASDCTPPTKRARALSFIYGCLFAGIAFGPIVSAKLVQKTGNLVAPFYLAFGIFLGATLFLGFVVPESAPLKRQITARKEWEEAKLAAGPSSRWKKILSLPKALSVLWPTGPGSSVRLRRNLVLLAAVDTVCFGVAMGAMTVILVYSRQAFAWDHSMTQYYVSTVNICRVVILLALLPAMNRLLRGKSGSDQKHGHTGADNIDLGFIRAGIFFDLIGFIGFATSTQSTMFVLSGAVASVGGIVSPTLSSALTRHLPPHLTGQLLGAMGLLHALARIVSPAIFNSIFALTTDSFPQAVFVCLACAFGVAAGISWFVKPDGESSFSS